GVDWKRQSALNQTGFHAGNGSTTTEAGSPNLEKRYGAASSWQLAIPMIAIDRSIAVCSYQINGGRRDACTLYCCAIYLLSYLLRCSACSCCCLPRSSPVSSVQFSLQI